MDERDIWAEFDAIRGEIFEAAHTPVGFIAALAVQLTLTGALSVGDLEVALDQERGLIEGLRKQGLDPRLQAVAFERLRSLIEYRLDDQRRFRLSPAPWIRNPQDPTWPRMPDEVLDPANQP